MRHPRSQRLNPTVASTFGLLLVLLPWRPITAASLVPEPPAPRSSRFT
jgi:hypothetical protein